MPDDGYADYYATKLWQLIPAIYRSLDSEPQAPGPLREMVNRIGAEAAVVRRSIDRMWEDQSIETCDDWVIPYIGDLVATNLVTCLDSRGQRLDVAKTIYYRRRKGTLGLLEELASDIANADARVVEFFRRLGRTRHNFDPPIGRVPFFDASTDTVPAAVLEGLAGAYTRTPMGGYADLRQAYGATRTGTAFDEYAHTADFRRGRESVGWHATPRLGVFQWWTSSFGVAASTPVQDAVHAGAYTFDPTGRELQLFARSQRSAEQFGEHWIAPEEWDLPVKISMPLWKLRPNKLYPDALSVLEGTTDSLVGLDRVTVNPERGRFCLTGTPPSGGVVHTKYCYGLTAPIGAGPYDQRLSGARLPDAVAPSTKVIGNGDAFNKATAALGAQGSLRIADSITYDAPTDLGGTAGFQKIAIFGDNGERPVVRWTTSPRPSWVLTGAPGATAGTPAATLLLQGLFLSGADVVLRGQFDSVRIRCSTLDPGNAADPSSKDPYAGAVDGRLLAPTRLFVEADVRELVIERSILGPVRTRNGGAIESLRISDSIVQAVAANEKGAFALDDVFDADGFARKLKAAAANSQTGADPLSKLIHSRLLSAGATAVDGYQSGTASDAFRVELVTDLNAIVSGPALYDAAAFSQVRLSKATRDLLAANLPADLPTLNRLLLEEGYRPELALQAIATETGNVSLVRTTVLGPIAVHRLAASECILDDLVFAEDQQHGCVRFSAYADGSVVHQPYESVTVAPQAPLFESRKFGASEYGRLSDTVDALIVTGRTGASIAEGAQNGSEMGAFCSQKIPLKRRGLAQKFREFMPVGQVPVWLDVT